MILSEYHQPVLLSKVIELLDVKAGNIYIDATIGGGGYTEELLKRQGIVAGIDSDRDAIAYLKLKFAEELAENRLYLFNLNFRDIGKIGKLKGFNKFDGIIFDLGLSSNQLDKSKRGFSYQKDEPLDMRFDTNNPVKAEDLVNNLSKRQLYEIFTKNSEELNSGPISDAIVRTRTLKGRVRTTLELNEIIKSVLKIRGKDLGFGVLGRIYQALRIEVNDELKSLEIALDTAVSLLRPGGRIVVLSYHSLEDRIVKRIFNTEKAAGKIKILTKKPKTVDKMEIKINSRSKSAKLRAALKI